MHEGHRQRMLERLERSEESFCDHELLEILLFNAIPRRNTNDIAHNLLSKFGSIGGVFRASLSQLSSVDGIGDSTAAYLKCIGLFMNKMNREKDTEMPSLSCFDDFLKVLRDRFRNIETEIMELYSLDGREQIKNVCRYTSSDKGGVRIKSDDVIEFIVREKPVSMLIVHNHLTGDCTPSAEDNEFTAQVHMIAQMHGAKLRDHVIIAGEKNYSYYMTGHLAKIQEQFNMRSFWRERK